ncbi:hypothetical protein I4I77_25925 [Pseudonocardia sp. KRD-188]|uniref:hypothetical protein n=1 Tax=Pseudonocardia oceani TaxID=2792013 RepID=UPI001C4A46F1|nr:hypothetical protein [Pseudonocardia oceani]MBW0093027.1 hypothetical protein [Pseudonocardia oceani]
MTGNGSGDGVVVPLGYPATGAGGPSAPDVAWVLAGGLVLLGSAAVALQFHRRRNAR